ncbi:MAG: DNA topoisomerase IV subunit A [Alphaproteobacteria bacterium]|nr:DNA topoisomerase IV subunit A [Alphaproteobacteria bacterium]
MAKADPTGDIREVRLADALSERYLSYALSTIVSRSLPDVRDGLKPVHRRLLYAMRKLKMDPDAGFKKCARVVGDVIGKYHPHGDAAVYDTLVRLAQEFAQRYPLVDGQGNFGNVDGDNAAAMRYTEARLTQVAWTLLDGIDEDAVDFRDTYDGEDSEPIVLPSRFPNLLANGSAGIAVGMATSIPPHNIVELCNALAHLIKFPNVTFDKLAELVPGPDFPTGGVLIEHRDNVVEAYRTGRGGVRLRAKWAPEKLPRGLYQIVISEIPYQIQKSKLIEKIAELVITKKLPILADVRDESSEDIRIVLEPKSRAVEPDMLMEQLFRLTDLETRFPLNMNVLNANNTPGVMNLREVLQAFLDHRHDVLVRCTKFRLGKIEHRLEMLEGFLIAYLNLDKIIKIIRNEDEPKPKLMKAFKLTEGQAEAILNMRLRQLRKLEEQAIKDEHAALTKEGKGLRAMLRDPKRRWKTVGDGIADIKKMFSAKTPLGRRRTEIGEPPTAVVVPLDAMIEREPITVLASEKGWIKTQKGHVTELSELKYKEGDRGRFLLHAETTDKLLVFATNGRFYTLGCDKLPGGRGHGEPLRLMIDLTEGHDVAAMFIHKPAEPGEKPAKDAGRRLVVASESGRGFIVEEDSLIAQTRNGRQVLNLGDGEEAQTAIIIEPGHDHLAVLGANRKLLIFPLNELPVMTRGRGVILQRFAKGNLADVTTLNLKEGLSWRSGQQGMRTETDIKRWVGKRSQAGMVVPKGFSRANKFN